MTINITPEIILKLRREGFFPDEMFSLYFVLKALQNGEVELLNNYDDFNTSKRAVISLQTLYRRHMIEKAKEGSNTVFMLTDKGKDFLLSLEPIKEEKKKIECNEWIEEWNNLFPEKNQNGAIRQEIIDVQPRMNSFIKKYKYIKEVIFAATKAYLTTESSKDHFYTKRSTYFISKQGEGSLLATWCKHVLDNKINTGVLDSSRRTQLIQTVN